MAKHKKFNHKEYVEHKLKTSKDFRETYEQMSMSVDLAVVIAEMRKAAGFTQSKLAKMIGTTQSVIARLESAEYDGHSLPMLRKIALACAFKMELKLTPRSSRPARAERGSLKQFKRGLVLA